MPRRRCNLRLTLMQVSARRQKHAKPKSCRGPRGVVRPALVLVALLLAGCASPLAAGPREGDGSVTFDAIIIETRLGAITAIAFCDETPLTCDFMRGLVEGGYYDGRAFGRTIPGFVIQEVDRTGGTTDQPERVAAEFGTRVMFSAGAFGIARDADPNSGGSEFFVMDHGVSSLYGNYTAFAQVVEGMDVVRAIAREPAVKTGPASSVVASPPGSPVYFGVHDRVPVDPVAMTRVSWSTLSLSAEDAARYPLDVGESWRSDTHRSTLEWERTLAPGREAELTWYVWPRDTRPTASVQEPPPLTLANVKIHVAGPASATIEDAQVDTDAGTVRFRWTPPGPGGYVLRLEESGRDVGLQNLTLAAQG